MTLKTRFLTADQQAIRTQTFMSNYRSPFKQFRERSIMSELLEHTQSVQQPLAPINTNLYDNGALLLLDIPSPITPTLLPSDTSASPSPPTPDYSHKRPREVFEEVSDDGVAAPPFISLDDTELFLLLTDI